MYPVSGGTKRISRGVAIVSPKLHEHVEVNEREIQKIHRITIFLYMVQFMHLRMLQRHKKFP